LVSDDDDASLLFQMSDSDCTCRTLLLWRKREDWQIE